MHPRRSAFTLIELLVVIAIIAILAVVVVLTLNPAQLLAQSRDANRVSDMATLNSAINLYNTDQSGASSYSLGTASTSYISIPSSASNCSSLGIATSAYAYACATSANYRNASSSGWLPINFQNISAGAPFGSLPVDPVNQTSSNLYYSYETNGSTYVLSSFMESSKYAKNMATTGGIDPALYEIGSGLTTLPDASRGLVGYWPLNEGVGSTTIDWSGGGNNGAWYGTATGTSGYYSAGKTSQWAGAFDAGTYIYIPNASIFNPPNVLSLAFWVKNNGTTASYPVIMQNDSGGVIGYAVQGAGTSTNIYMRVDTTGGSNQNQGQIPNALDGNWHFIVFVLSNGNSSRYEDGSLVGTATYVPGGGFSSTSTFRFDNGFVGFLNDVRIYDRALSASEIQDIYNAEK